MLKIFRSLLGKLVAPSNRLLFLSVLLCAVNSFLLLVNNSSIREKCMLEMKSRFQLSIYDRPQNVVYRPPRDDKHGSNHWKIDEEEGQFRVTMKGDFNWDEEFVRLMSVIPVLEYRSNKTDDQGRAKMDVDEDPFVGSSTNFTNDWEHSSNVSEVLTSIDSQRISIKSIFEEWVNLPKASLGQFGYPFGCKKIRELEHGTTYPYLKYNFRSLTFWKGAMYLSRNETIDIVQKRYLNTSPPPGKTVNDIFELGKLEVLKLIKAQKLYGIPTLYGMCITTLKEKDTQQYYDNGEDELLEEGYMIRYIMRRFDERNSIRFCHTPKFTDECMRLNQLSTYVRSRERPVVAALQVMFNLARMFEDMWMNGVYIDELNADELILAKDLNVYVIGLQTMKFLTEHRYSLHTNSSRLLDGTICMKSNECPVPKWHASQIGFKIGMSCAECKGFCAMDNACWGVDTHTYACMFSRWFYTRLHDAIPPSWNMDHLLTKLISCGSETLPDTRCTWTDLRIGLEEFLKQAKWKWPSKDSAV